MRNLNIRGDYIQHILFNTDIETKENYIKKHCKGKKVLDLGCIDHGFETAIKLKNNWLHYQIKEEAAQLTGVDILSEDSARLNEAGYNIIAADVLTLDLNQKFDVIVAGDLIEHITCFDSFFESIKKHMHEESIAIITIPNPFNIEQTFAAIFDNKIHVNPEHTVWIDPRVMWELVKRYDFSIREFKWIDTRFHFNVHRKGWKKITGKLARFLARKRPILRTDFAIILEL